MSTDKLLVFVAVLVLVSSSLSFYLTFVGVSQINQLTGLTGSEGYVNLSVVNTLSINFTADTLNWSLGSIDSGQANATLETSGPSVLRGNWSTTGVSGFVIENVGSINSTLSLSTVKNATTLFGGSADHRAYRWNLTNNEAGSCTPSTFSNSSYRDVNTSGYGFCNQFGFLNSQDSVRLDIYLTIPYDGNSGALSDTITATASPA